MHALTQVEIAKPGDTWKQIRPYIDAYVDCPVSFSSVNSLSFVCELYKYKMQAYFFPMGVLSNLLIKYSQCAGIRKSNTVLVIACKNRA